MESPNTKRKFSGFKRVDQILRSTYPWISLPSITITSRKSTPLPTETLKLDLGNTNKTLDEVLNFQPLTNVDVQYNNCVPIYQQTSLNVTIDLQKNLSGYELKPKKLVKKHKPLSQLSHFQVNSGNCSEAIYSNNNNSEYQNYEDGDNNYQFIESDPDSDPNYQTNRVGTENILNSISEVGNVKHDKDGEKTLYDLKDSLNTKEKEKQKIPIKEKILKNFLEEKRNEPLQTKTKKEDGIKKNGEIKKGEKNKKEKENINQNDKTITTNNTTKTNSNKKETIPNTKETDPQKSQSNQPEMEFWRRKLLSFLQNLFVFKNLNTNELYFNFNTNGSKVYHKIVSNFLFLQSFEKRIVNKEINDLQQFLEEIIEQLLKIESQYGRKHFFFRLSVQIALIICKFVVALNQKIENKESNRKRNRGDTFHEDNYNVIKVSLISAVRNNNKDDNNNSKEKNKIVKEIINDNEFERKLEKNREIEIKKSKSINQQENQISKDSGQATLTLMKKNTSEKNKDDDDDDGDSSGGGDDDDDDINFQNFNNTLIQTTDKIKTITKNGKISNFDEIKKNNNDRSCYYPLFFSKSFQQIEQTQLGKIISSDAMQDILKKNDNFSSIDTILEIFEKNNKLKKKYLLSKYSEIDMYKYDQNSALVQQINLMPFKTQLQLWSTIIKNNSDFFNKNSQVFLIDIDLLENNVINQIIEFFQNYLKENEY
ncbi:hypothetical protein M0812_19766 [Anaeramoeba flamelloides]|uniref:Uncharacterized protein n=1 Tax=Anaeramoeba flamelloides TaxID=1746091 RepID=A0AAV7Z3M1_9EUKA|nr:hypothetical protein M0812_19766 [Anaeramoeba flamelloides]